jgi:SagB-type dehydrogenase family enzyme
MKLYPSILLLLFIFINSAISQEAKKISLPPPQTEIGKPLMQALNLRHTTREFNTKALSLQDLSNLLWAADGINRKDDGKRTAPSAMNNQETIIFVTMQNGAYTYNAKDNTLDPVLGEDIRELTGKQDFVKTAPLNIVYVADLSKMGKASNEDKAIYSALDVGFIAQNVCLYCASQGLSTVTRGFVDKEVLAKKLKLTKDQKIILTQTVGYPK